MVDMWLRIGALVVASLGAALAGLLAAFLVPLHIGGVRFPVSLLIVVLGNALAVSFAHRVAEFRWGVLAPAAAWLAVTLPLGSARTEGDVVLANDWVSLSTVLFGGATLAFAIFVVITGTPFLSFAKARREGTRELSPALRIGLDGPDRHR